VAALPALVAQKEFDAADVRTVVALVIAINQAVVALAPAILSSLREISANDTLSFGIAAIVQVMAALVSLVGRRAASDPRWNS
jgi:hypothetical protein